MFERDAVQPPLLINKAVIFGTQHGLAPRIKHNSVKSNIVAISD